MDSRTIQPAQRPGGVLPLEELELLRRLVLYSEEDARLLRRALPRLLPVADDLLDVLMGLLAGLVAATPDAAAAEPPDLVALQESFRLWLAAAGRWPPEPTLAPPAALWPLAPPAATSAAALVALAAPLVLVARPYLEQAATGLQELEALQRAWTKAVVLQASLGVRAAAAPAAAAADD